MHLGFEVRVELELGDGERAVASQLTRDEADELELRAGRHRVGAPAGVGEPSAQRSRVAGALSA